MSTWPSPRSERLGTPKNPAIRFARGKSYEASLVRFRYGLSGCSPPCTDLTGFPASGGFYIQASNEMGSLLDMTTAVTGLLCWRDLHPQEWQLASLHDLSGSQATHPVPLPRSKTPAEPTFPRQ